MMSFLRKNMQAILLVAVLGGLAQLSETFAYFLSGLVVFYLLFQLLNLATRFILSVWKTSPARSSAIRVVIRKILISIILVILILHGEFRIFGIIKQMYAPNIEQLESYKLQHGSYPASLDSLNQIIQQCPGTLKVHPDYNIYDNGANYCLGCPAEMGDEYRYCSEDKGWRVF